MEKNGRETRYISITNIKTQKETNELSSDRQWVSAVAFSGSKANLFAAAFGKIVRVWDLKTGKVVRTVNAGEGMTALAFYPDGRTISCAATALAIWDVRGSRELTEAVVTGHSRSVRWLAFEAASDILATSSSKSILLWEIRTGNRIGTIRGTGPLHFAEGKLLFVKARRIYSVTRSKGRYLIMPLTELIPSDILDIATSADGKKLVVMTSDGRISIFKLATGEVQIKANLSKTLGDSGVAKFGSCGEVLVAASLAPFRFQGGLRLHWPILIWKVKADRQLHKLTGHFGDIKGLAFSSDGAMLAVCCANKMVMVWQTATGKKLLTIKTSKASPVCIEFSPGAAALAVGYRGTTSGKDDDRIEIWSLKSRKRVSTISTLQYGEVASLVFESNRKIIAAIGTAAFLFDCPEVASRSTSANTRDP